MNKKSVVRLEKGRTIDTLVLGLPEWSCSSANGSCSVRRLVKLIKLNAVRNVALEK